ncbi:MAG TPA: glycosyltransferase family 1 protein [Anaerolineae bacterium]|nr:glycosyltransferase family 1 protein [Anaerolineae bacterium]
MNIGIDAHMLGHNETGNETYVLELVRALAVRDPGDTFFVYVENPHALSPEITNAAQVRVVPYATRSGARRLVWELSRRAAQDCLDVLHLSYNAPLHVPPACALVVTIHDISFEHFPQFFSRRLRAFLRVSVPRSAYAAQHIITDTESAKRDLVNTYRLPPDKITVTHYAAGAQFHPISDPAALNAVRARYNTGDRFILAVGNLQPRKNLERLMRAFALAKQHAALPHKLVIVGQRLWRAAPILQAARGMPDQVILTGYVPATDLPLLYNAADVLAYPSLYEGFGLPVLEAMACGTPVITSNVSCLPEIAGDAAHLINPRSVQDIADALVRVTTDTAYRGELGRRGVARAQLFSWERTAQQTLAVYYSAIARKRAATRTVLA